MAFNRLAAAGTQQDQARQPGDFMARFVFWRVIVLVITLSAGGAGAQNFSLERFTTRNGLRTSAVGSITQTSDGNLWIGTRAGLARYDGSQFKVFTPENFPGLKSKYLNYTATGPDSTLYVGADDQLCVLSHGQWRNFATYRGDLASKVLIILAAGPDEAWIGTRFGLLFHYKNGDMKEFAFRFAADTSINGLAKTSDGTLWVATTNGLFSISQGKVLPYQPKLSLPVKSFYHLSVSADGTLFAASDRGLFGIRGDRWRSWDKDSGLPSNELNVLATDAHGALWIGTRSGLARLEGGTVRPITSMTCSVHALFVDAQNSLWIGCDDVVGLFRLTAYQFPFLTPPRAHEIASASLAVDQTGAVWIGTHEGLYKYSNGGFRTYSHRDGLPSDQIFDVSVARGNTVWVATANGLASVNNGHITSLRGKDADFARSFFSALESRDGTLWVTSEQGLGRRLPGKSSLSFEPGFTNLVESVYEDHVGAVWVSTDLHGLVRFSGGVKTTYRETCGLGSNTVYSTVQDDSDTLWAWTFGGLSRIRGGRCANIPPDAGLPKNEPGSLAYDGSGHLWLRTQSGVAAIDLVEANDVIENPRPLQRTRFIGSEEGLDSTLNDLEMLNIMARPTAGEIWIPTAAGIAVLNGPTVQRPLTHLHPQVTSVVSDTGEHDTHVTVRLQPDDLHLRFEYKVPSLFGASGRVYRYRLSGYDKSWREGKEGEDAAYTSVPAGTYQFQVSSRDPFDRWQAISDPIYLVILPHFYRTWWWYSLLAFIAAGVIWLAYSLRLMTLRKQYAAVITERDRERSRLARELHDTLSRGMMAIHMQLQLARAFLPAQPEHACKHVDAAVGIVRESATDTRKSIAALRSANEKARSLSDLLHQMADTFNAYSTISLIVDIASDVPDFEAEMRHEITRIVDEALSNVQQHSGARTARLNASREGQCLRIEISDDGRGFEAKAIEKTDREHFGMQGMRERADKLNATLNTDCIPGKGTSIVLEVPVRSRRQKRWRR